MNTTLIALCVLGCVYSHAQITAQPISTEKQAAVQDVSCAQFEQHVERLQEIAVACKVSASACAGDVGPDDKVSAEGQNPAFTEHWQWLRDALEDAAKAKQDDRAQSMLLASVHLDELKAESNGVPDAHGSFDFTKANKKAMAVLARPEFRRAAAAEPSWLDRQMTRFWMWVGQLFAGINSIGKAAPWLGKVLEWTFFLLAAVGLLLFIRRNLARQQLQIAMNPGARQFSAWDREANDWAADAEAHAAKHQWRDAVHCMYWAAIVRLEARRAWRHNPARTPREYVRLLQSGSPQQGALRGLTNIFERVWYGLRDPEATDYERAKMLFTQLNETSLTAGAAS